ncbi:unnamed protein product [Cryptosporidium hominis]|uniref:Uncharacterized protein n=1 Tax=Cryptosporidium hominis TaxID=237895 RepID=A0A0S4TJS8_CRYHO|nr:hypothetical protein ChTU502y2012_409g0055 [Cryptosporidium hominis]PPA65343.1 hypothetical protein ChUKH1_16565 [Cryptosporidium hominis]CUV07649.1 unnamed protein product [Cryptosporidium hominis]
MKFNSKNERTKELKCDEDVKIVMHSNELGVELPTLETTDSIDRQSNDSISSAQIISLTPKRCSKGKEISNIEYMASFGKENRDLNQGDVTNNMFGSQSSSLVNSVERTTAPSSMMGSLSRYDSYNSNLSPNTNFQTPGRDPKRRNISNISSLGESFQNKENEKSNNSNFLGSRKDLVESNGLTNISGVSNSTIQSNQINNSVLLSAVLQVIASIQKLKNGEQANAVSRGRMATNTANINNTNTVMSNGVIINNNATTQILGSKLPGVHPTTAALALAYSLSVAASAKRNLGGTPVNFDDVIQGLNQIISEKNSNNNLAMNTENTDNLKISGELIQSIVSSLSSLISNSQGESANTIQKKDKDCLVSPNRTNEFSDISKISKLGGIDSRASGPSYNLKLPPMDFIINEKSLCNDFRRANNFQNVGNNNFNLNKSVLLDVTNNISNANNYKFQSYLEAESSLVMEPRIEDSFSQIEYVNQTSQMNRLNHSKSTASNTENIQNEISNNSRLLRENNYNPLLSEIYRCSEKKIILESSNNCIWNDLLYNQVFDHVDFETPFTRKHAYMRNELVFCNKPILEIDHGGDSFSMPSYIRIPSNNFPNSNNRNAYSNNNNINHSNIYNNSKPNFTHSSKYPPPNNFDFYNLHKYNPRIQSFCDDLLVNTNNRRNSQIFNSINYLMQIVGDGNMNNNNSNNGK